MDLGGWVTWVVIIFRHFTIPGKFYPNFRRVCTYMCMHKPNHLHLTCEVKYFDHVPGGESSAGAGGGREKEGGVGEVPDHHQ